jgi:hypothetical protein
MILTACVPAKRVVPSGTRLVLNVGEAKLAGCFSPNHGCCIVFGRSHHLRKPTGATVTTFAAFHSPASRLPVSQVRPKNFIDRCCGALVRTAVDRDRDSEVLKKFLLFRADDAKERQFFTDCKLLHLLQCADHFQIRSSPDWLLIFRPGRITNARNLPQFVHVTSTIAFGLLDPELQPG